MAHMWGEVRAPNYEQFAERKTPIWFKNAKFGIFVHWGPYSVPAWAETTGELGHIPEELVHKHNPYAEWYFNTIRIKDSPASKHHKEVYGDAPYDNFLDQWKASQFDASKLVKLFKEAGAEYIMPVTKHHDGITLWDAPETGDRNTVKRGPKRDIIAEWAQACEREDIKFGVYYSTGIDWHYWPTKEPWGLGNEDRPGLHEDATEYNKYARQHCADLIDRYKPYLLWGDCDWPKAGIAPGEYSVENLLKKLYKANPEAVINDRFGNTHWDFHTVEYGLSAPPKDEDEKWTFTRGIGLSFGYNKQELESHSLTGKQAATLLVDVVSKGADLLLNVGPDADGNIPPVQQRCLEDLAKWNKIYGEGIFGTTRVEEDIAQPIGKSGAGENWVRWTQKGDSVFAFVDAGGDETIIRLPFSADKLDVKSAKLLGGDSVVVNREGGFELEQLGDVLRPACIQFRIV